MVGAPMPPAPMPQMPSFNPAPFSAPRPGRPSLQPDFAQRAAPPMIAPRYNPLVAVILVILAAVAAATTVYFVLPLLT
jgi:hypothetical protein